MEYKPGFAGRTWPVGFSIKRVLQWMGFCFFSAMMSVEIYENIFSGMDAHLVAVILTICISIGAIFLILRMSGFPTYIALLASIFIVVATQLPEPLTLHEVFTALKGGGLLLSFWFFGLGMDIRETKRVR